VITRIGRYVVGSFPPAFYLPYALAWSLGMTAAFVLGEPGLRSWRPGIGTVLTALTFGVLLLLARAVDDLRDREYDREHNPGRPLASGAVRVRDLVVLIAACVVVALALNAGQGGVAVMVLVVLGYPLLLLLVDRWLHWPSGDNLLLSGVVSFPVQVLFNLYLYAAVMHAAGLPGSWHVVLPLLVGITAFVHIEYARKLTRTPKPGERSYVTALGATRTGVLAVLAGVVATALALLLTRPWSTTAPWGWLVLLPLAFLGYGAYRFWVVRATRWPLLAAAAFLLTGFVTYLIVGLIGKDLP